MAQIHFTLEENEILDLPSKDQIGAFTVLPASSLKSILLSQADVQLKAGLNERPEEHTNVRNEYWERSEYAA